MFSGYSADVVRSSYLDGEDEDPFAMDSSVLEETDDRSPPPDYNDGEFDAASVNYFMVVVGICTLTCFLIWIYV